MQCSLSFQIKTRQMNHTLSLRRWVLLSSFLFASQKAHWVGKWHGGQLCMTAPSLFPASKADIDNLKKVVLDALNGIAYADDGQVASVCATKVFTTLALVMVPLS